MTSVRCFVFLGLLTGVAAMDVTPIQQVIKMIDGLISQVDSEGKNEAELYANFSAYCKDNTKETSDSITKEEDRVAEESADIAEENQEKNVDISALGDRKAQQEVVSADLDSLTVRCAKEKAEYESQSAELAKAIATLKAAISSMEASESGAEGAVLLQSSVSQDLLETIHMAEAMSLVTVPKRKAAVLMLQRKTSKDLNSDKQDILDLMEGLKKDFMSQKTVLEEDEAHRVSGCDESKESFADVTEKNSAAIGALDKDIERLGKEVAEDKEDLLEEETELQDDSEHLKQLTSRCESRAKDWDERSAMRAGELQALSSAVDVLSGKVKSAADAVNSRALIQKVQTPTVQTLPKSLSMFTLHAHISDQGDKNAPMKPSVESVSFLQRLLAKEHPKKSFLAVESKRDKAIALLASEGQRLGSTALISLGLRAGRDDPFSVVKGMIEKLQAGLEKEASEEKDWCRTMVPEAEEERGVREQDKKDISAELESLQAKKDSLIEEGEELTSEIEKETNATTEAVAARSEEKDSNAKTLTEAHEGVKALEEAVVIIKSFYAGAAKVALLQQEPPTAGLIQGPYKGKQDASTGVIALLDTIADDFDRTIRMTEAAETSGSEAFAKASLAAKMSLASKSTKKQLVEQDVQTTKTSIKTKSNNLKTAQALLDVALEELNVLKEQCADKAVDYEANKEKREKEMQALTKALCMLDENGVEEECQ